MKDINCSSAPENNSQLAVHIWLQDIPTNTSRISITSVLNIDDDEKLFDDDNDDDDDRHHRNKYQPKHTTTTPNHVITDPLCTMARSSEKNLAALANSGTLILFTPVINPGSASAARTTDKPTNHHPPSTTTTTTTTTNPPTDPFEPLGRALSHQHPRIRHVPYHPRPGYTPTHHAFADQADAAIVVLCANGDGDGSPRGGALADQMAFATRAAAALRRRRVPVALVACGDPGAAGWSEEVDGVFETVVRCRGWDAEVAGAVAGRLLGGWK